MKAPALLRQRLMIPTLKMSEPDATPTATPPVALHLSLNQETAPLAWQELQRFFAQGRVLWVREGLDLIAVAAAVAQDDAPHIAALMTSGKLLPVPNQQARHWLATEAQVWTVVVKPWILVQEMAG
jgi:hypothetical protein